MKHLSEYRDAPAARELCARIHRATTRPWSILEVCGGQTHSIVRHGLEQQLPAQLRLLHGPGCPVCVTPARYIDAAIQLASQPDVTVCSFGDLLRVPGSSRSLLGARALGASVKLVYSPLDALALAKSCPERQVVFFAVGFETTAPATAMTLRLARSLPNYSVLCAHVRVPAALERLLADEEAGVDGLLAAGHVCSVMGLEEYHPLATRHRTPIVATGFEPVDLLRGVLACVEQLEAGRAEVDNQYERVVAAAGNPAARALLSEVFEPCDLSWRGLGLIPEGGLRLRPHLQAWDAARRFELELSPPERSQSSPAQSSPAQSSPAQSSPAQSSSARSGPARSASELSGQQSGEAKPPPSTDARTVSEAADGPTRPNTPPQTLPGHSPETSAASLCIAGQVLMGRRRPQQCPAFGSHCTPDRPLGAPMVSGEGACAAYYRYGRMRAEPAARPESGGGRP